MDKFDDRKSPLELKIEHVTKVLAITHPEQTADAMADYAKALRIISNSKEYRVQPLIEQLKRLYIYPNRPEHRKMLIELYDVKEQLHEERLNKISLDKPKARTNLGDGKKPSQLPWLVIAVIAVIVLLK